MGPFFFTDRKFSRGSGCGCDEMPEKARSETMNIMTVDGQKAGVEYAPELDMFRGEISGFNGGADFYGQTTDELRNEFRNSLKVFLEMCREK